VTTMQVPRSRAHLFHAAIREALLTALEPILFEPHQLDNAALRPLEEQFARWVGGPAFGHPFAYAVNSGTAGLFLALRACRIGPGQEVITVGNSDISTTAAISHCGAIPVLCDVSATDHTMDVDQVEALITPRTAALLPVDMYGHPADVKRLRTIADRHGLKIIEDATLATGACDYGQPVGAFSDVAVFSFGAHKPLGSTGNGGIAVTKDPEIAQRLRLLRSYGRALDSLPGQSMFGNHAEEGYNLPMDLLQAAIVSVKLPYIPEWTARRRAIAQQYAAGLCDPRIQHPVFRSGSEPTFYSYVVRVPNRDALYHTLRGQGIEVALHYVPPVHCQLVYRDHPLAQSSLPVTDRLAGELLGLPIDPALEDAEVGYIIHALMHALDEGRGMA
jgi:dTDP-4-amino-4,6-dideoxygalactose transaminase